MSFREHEELDYEEGIGTYIPCFIKYGDLKQPRCPHRAYQVFDKNVGIIV